MMSTICFRKSSSVLMLFLALSLTMIGLEGITLTSVAQEKDTVSDQTTDTLKLKLGTEKEKVTLSIKTGAEKKNLTKEIIISEEGVILNGKKFDLAKLADSAKVSISIEGGSIARFGEPVVIAEGEVVDGDVFSFGGHITVAGTVTGDVAIIGANLLLRPTGVIKGDVFTIGGTIHQEPGGQIRGQRAGILPQDFQAIGPLSIILDPTKHLRTLGLILLVLIIFSIVLVALAGFFAPQQIERIYLTIESDPLKSILLGVAAFFISFILLILLSITIIGLPVALIALPIAYFVAATMGFAGVSLFVGVKLHRGTSQRLANPMAKIMVGTLFGHGALILAWLFTLGGRAFAALFWLFFLIGGLVVLVASAAGLGATVWSRFGSRPSTASNAAAPAAIPPPVPNGEPETSATP